MASEVKSYIETSIIGYLTARSVRSLLLFIIVSAVISCGKTPSRMSVDETLARIDEIGEPDFDPSRKEEPGYLENYKREQHQLYRQKAKFLLDLCHGYPDDPRVPDWMDKRWLLLGWNQNPQVVADEVLADIDATAPTVKNVDVTRHSMYWKCYYLLQKNDNVAANTLGFVEAFVSRYEDDDRGAELLSLAAERSSVSHDQRTALYRELADKYPRTHYGTYAPGMIRRLEGLGKPFELVFDDFSTGRRISVADLRGQIVVIDFWATTCVPCLAALPQMKELYASYRSRGVEFIGVSLDESEEHGGESALRRCIKANKIPWPQYYQGAGYDSEFSRSWGVGSAPTIFLLDGSGRLQATDVQAETLGDTLNHAINQGEIE